MCWVNLAGMTCLVAHVVNILDKTLLIESRKTTTQFLKCETFTAPLLHNELPRRTMCIEEDVEGGELGCCWHAVQVTSALIAMLLLLRLLLLLLLLLIQTNPATSHQISASSSELKANQQRGRGTDDDGHATMTLHGRAWGAQAARSAPLTR